MPFSSFSAFTAPAMMPMELKLANDTMKMERMPTVRGERSAAILPRSIMATNSLVTSLVAMMEPACSASLPGMPRIQAMG
ncbi:hypothetical protein D3C75_1225290 [compost metagenome]